MSGALRSDFSARNVAAVIFVPAVAALQVPAKVDHAEVRVVDVVAQPGGFDERSEFHYAPTRVSWQKCTACGWIACTFSSERVHASRSACWPRHGERSAFSKSR